MNKDIEEAARKYLGTPFRHQGRNKYGLDCVGLLIKVAHDLNITDFDYTNYSVIPNPKIMRHYLTKYMDRIHISKKAPGDIFYMSFYKNPQHISIYTSNDTIIHSASVFKGVVEHSLNTFWKQRIVEVYRIRRD